MALMQPRLALSLGALFYIAWGLPFLLAPGPLLSMFGWDVVPGMLVATRDVGTLLIGVGIIDWLARDTVGAPLRGLLWANIIIRVVAAAVNGLEFAAGVLPATLSSGLVVAVFGLNTAVIVMFALALRRS